MHTLTPLTCMYHGITQMFIQVHELVSPVCINNNTNSCTGCDTFFVLLGLHVDSSARGKAVR